MGKLQFLLRVPIEGGRSLHGFHCHSHRPRQCAVDRHLADICQVQSSRTSDLLRRPRRHPTCQRVIRQYCALALACFAAGGCATDPRLRPSLLVTNATCESGVCCPLYIRAFVWDFNIPQSPGGIETFGYVHGATGCIKFPSEWTVTVSGPNGSEQQVWKPSSPGGCLPNRF